MSVPDPQPVKTTNVRRSQRVYLSVEVVVIQQRPNGISHTEETHTLVVNAHGALLLLHMDVAMRDLLTLRNVKTLGEMPCRVVDLGTLSPSGAKEIGVEFVTPSPRFWRVAFPPLDWSPRSPEAKGHRPQVVAAPSTTKQS